MSDENCRVIDVGANSGLFYLQLANMCNNAVLIEPSPDTFQLLRFNMLLNNLGRSTILCNFAAGLPGAQDLYLNQVDHFGATNYVSSTPDMQSSVKIESRAIDALVRESPPKQLAVLKVDTEGSELNVLNGAIQTISSSPNCILCVENNNTVELCRYFRKLDLRLIAVYRNLSFVTQPSYISKEYNLIAVGRSHELYQDGIDPRLIIDSLEVTE